ncbi:hypothetical protein [Archaeoglobus neptunius]|uniref:hypothetical protein n=1 Tax=Archaeoglobus neptunius TaxID=2798580 RepID=UPI0019282A8A|nr:hypothetical protein [Archaeoglobus neptunius]
MRKCWILTMKEREFIEDWLKVVDGEMELLEFYAKWGSKKGESGVYDDYQKVRKGEMSLEEFREKWTKRGDWKDYVRVMRHRLERKRKNIKRIVREINEELRLLKEFHELRELP